MSWLLVNPLMSVLLALCLGLGAMAGVQTYRLKSAKADVKMAQADIALLKSEIAVQSSKIKLWTEQAEASRQRADQMMGEANIFREQRDMFALKLRSMKLPKDECSALAALVDAHREATRP